MLTETEVHEASSWLVSIGSWIYLAPGWYVSLLTSIATSSEKFKKFMPSDPLPGVAGNWHPTPLFKEAMPF